MICAGEQDATTYHFAHDAAHGPDVHVLGVAHAEDDFWCPVVACYHVRGHHERGAGRAGQTKVEDF